MPSTTAERRSGRLRRVKEKIIGLYNSGEEGFSAADISKSCNLKSGGSAARIIASILPDEIGGITYTVKNGKYLFTGGPEKSNPVVPEGSAHVFAHVTDEWAPASTIAAFANISSRRVYVHLARMVKSGAIECMFDEYLGVRYYRLKRDATFHRASVERAPVKSEGK